MIIQDPQAVWPITITDRLGLLIAFGAICGFIWTIWRISRKDIDDNLAKDREERNKADAAFIKTLDAKHLELVKDCEDNISRFKQSVSDQLNGFRESVNMQLNGFGGRLSETERSVIEIRRSVDDIKMNQDRVKTAAEHTERVVREIAEHGRIRDDRRDDFERQVIAQLARIRAQHEEE